ncbi:MAG: hypothetical protein WCD89_18890 [Anaerocolumna sp.]
MEGVENDDILPRYHGILSHGYESKFYNYGTQHAACCEHLLRELIGLRELLKITWAVTSCSSMITGHHSRTI